MDRLSIILIPILVFLLLCSSIFSSCETAYSTLNPGKLETMIDKKEFGSKLIKKQYKFFNRMLGLILICNNLVNIGLSAAVSYLLSKNLSASVEQYSALISTAVLTPVIVIVGEILPKLIAKAHPEKVAKTFCYVLEVLYWVFFPICWLIGRISKSIYITNTEQDVKNLLDVAHTEGVLEANESIMAQNALDLDTTKIRKHYIKIKDMSYLPYNATIVQAQEMFKKTNYSRLPIEKDGQFLGIVLLKDIFFLKKGKVITYMKSVPTISANSTLASALERLRFERAQMAFVTNNMSSSEILGIITIEDILEEIVGEIYDEYDEDELKEFFEISLELFHVSGGVKMKQVLKQMNLELKLSDEELNSTLEKWAKTKHTEKLNKNTKFEVDGVSFKVLTSPTTKQKHYRFEIEIGTQAPVNIEPTMEI
ncbi:hemolysin family protein [Mycoplasma zalophidermidis]|uniref:hemolysin family protein n=1 Tax=Mycoplasma zalophidermidis TaxID=398174 RepID=UPI001C0FAE6A|nr:hemolysin family protein [Mycoplasma zalophidermidis]MBU4689968.1 hemolysin family protein [Mycoplasma zalophidermidis]MCR8966439.1 hemolysin family protein [Mycoplasma zalophidermidis]